VCIHHPTTPILHFSNFPGGDRAMQDGTNQKEKPFILKELTHKIIGAALEVYKILGYGFVGDVYEQALLKEFQLRGIPAKSRCPVDLNYKGNTIPGHLPGILVDDRVIVELQTKEKFSSRNEYNIINFLKATGIKVGLIINFGKDGCKPKRYVC
jgi:GxxExxY protein